MVKYVRAERGQDADDGKILPGFGGTSFGVREDDGGAQLRHFLELMRSNPGCRKPLMHVMISWDREEFPTPAQVKQAVQVWAHEAGADGLDLLWAVHGNTQHRHAHVLVCLVDPLTTRVRDLGLWKRKSQYAKARIIGLQELESCADDLYLPASDGGVAVNPAASHWQGPGGFALPRLDDPADAVAKVRALVMPALEKASSWSEFHEALVKAGVGMRKSGRGIAFLVGGAEVKGSKVSKQKCSLKALEKAFGAPFAEGPASAKAAPEDIKVIRNPDARFWRGREPGGPEIPPALTPEAQAIEQRHGIKSRQRLEQEQVPAALERAEAAGGWRAFHEALAESGITVRPSGTGLVYVIG
ncbi:MAG: relaxase/mobilization nuclease domain-containing protein, partial [Desulfovibrio sp.]|nr:relaxase/mobilization nuclease domain-containing protein [Desulfovibrio sp.]